MFEDERFKRWAIVFLIIFVLFTLLIPEERREFRGYAGPAGY